MKQRTLTFEKTPHGGLFKRTSKGTELSVSQDRQGYWYWTYKSQDDLEWSRNNTYIPPKHPDENVHRDTYMDQEEATQGLMKFLNEANPAYYFRYAIEKERS